MHFALNCAHGFVLSLVQYKIAHAHSDCDETLTAKLSDFYARRTLIKPVRFIISPKWPNFIAQTQFRWNTPATNAVDRTKFPTMVAIRPSCALGRNGRVHHCHRDHWLTF